MLLLTVALAALSACRDEVPRTPDAMTASPWPDVVAAARGTEVTWRMWRGDPAINAYVETWVAPRLEEEYDLSLRVVDGQGGEVVNQLVVEREAGARGRADLVWINGETFHHLRQEGLLWGPWAHRIPGAFYVDSASSIVMRDFEQDPDGLESPWGRVQFALIYDEARTPDPPGTVAELARWIDEHPGRFTHDQGFTGVTFLKILMYALSGGVEVFQGAFDETAYLTGRDRTLEWLEARRSGFWREGRAYPAGVAELHRLFANGEVDFTMSNNHNEVITKIRQGLFPETARPLLLRDGTIANAHYLGIPFNAPNPAGAMVVADFLLSPEAQLEKARPGVWGDGSVLDPERLPEPWRRRFQALERDPRALPSDSLRHYALPEVAPEYHERLAEDWRQRIRPVR